MAKRGLISLLLAFVTLELFGALVFLPDEVGGSIKDALGLPGALLSAPFFPQGIHNESGAVYWPLVVYLGNLLFYSALWFGLLTLFQRLRRGRNVPNIKSA